MYLGTKVEVTSDLVALELQEVLVIVSLSLEVNLGLERRIVARSLWAAGWLGVLR